MSANQQSLMFDHFFGGEPIGRPLSREECLPPRSRTKDPLSSKRAEADAKHSGVMRGQRVIALSMVEANPGETSKRLGEIGPLDRYQLARRLPELLKMKLVRTTQNGSEDLRWFPVDCR